MQVTRYICEKCGKENSDEKKVTVFGTWYKLNPHVKLNKQTIKVEVKFSKKCLEAGDLCDPCASIILKKAIKGTNWEVRK